MHLLYLDDSGSVQNRADQHIILAGVSVFEREIHWVSKDLDDIAGKVWPDNPLGIEFRGADMFSGKKHWRGQEKSVRLDAYKAALTALASRKGVRLFGAAVRRDAAGTEDPMEFAFEHVAHRFDRMLGRLHKSGDTQRGLIVLDESSYETSLQALTLKFRTAGHRWGNLYNLSEVPLFVDSRATRLIQAADLIAYALRQFYERGEPAYFDIIKTKFDAVGGVVYGLSHLHGDETCSCYACKNGVSKMISAVNR
ncbi:DUF3800 domain-containing protein [Brevundimonas diminuta]|uniref:DUF3800 domain-containing protein n=1 Tax=Brevundimonas diminuta TaxID=293 RepID=UPI0020972B39|nr:DUF3800 domain-containing protein [Brevundimonas diminuta]MCO8017493.1 DUF3800 domain-containing protein [Brevundimonas diminuta]MCO8021013.1 DUF3800 domain-containing protein [Brevundimonas diminuta]